MARYTLKTFCGTKQMERFEHRNVDKLRSILNHPRHHRSGETGPFGEPQEHVDRFEVFDTMMEKLFTGTVEETLKFIKKLK